MKEEILVQELRSLILASKFVFISINLNSYCKIAFKK